VTFLLILAKFLSNLSALNLKVQCSYKSVKFRQICPLSFSNVSAQVSLEKVHAVQPFPHSEEVPIISQTVEAEFQGLFLLTLNFYKRLYEILYINYLAIWVFNMLYCCLIKKNEIKTLLYKGEEIRECISFSAE